MMPVLDGMEVCRRLRAESDLPILMLTARDEIGDRVQGLDAGADDYLVKPFALEELLARLRALLRRGKSGNQDSPSGNTSHALGQAIIYNFTDLRLDTGTREAFRGTRVIQLTTKEFELLSLFMKHPRQVLTREVIMDRIWGFDYSGESNVLEVYVGMLRQKLEEAGEKRLLHTVRRAGYTLRE
jgi:two-component system response regulator MprA